VNSRGKTELADDVHTAIYAIGEPFMQRRKKIGQNSLTPYQMIFIMQDIERVKKLKLPAPVCRQAGTGRCFREMQI